MSHTPAADERFYQRLYTGLLHSDISSLLSLIYDTWALPVSVIDTHYNLIGMCPLHAIGDPTYDAIVEAGAISQQMQEGFLAEKYMLRILECTEPQELDWGVAARNHRLSYPLVDRGVFYGCISLVLVNGFQWKPSDSQLLLQIAAACTQILARRQELETSRGSAENYMLATVLDSGILSPDLPGYFQKKLGRTPKYLLLRLSNTAKPSPFYLTHLQRRLNTNFPDALCVPLHGALYLLFAAPRKSQLRTLCAQLETVLQGERTAFAGASRIFQDLTQAQACRQQADFAYACAVSDAASRILWYADLVMRHILSILAAQLPSGALDDGVIRTLEEYDQETGSAYLQTLQVYLQNLLDSKKTVEYFDIHRNTLLNRLNRITELTGLDFENQDAVLQTMLAVLLRSFSAPASN